MQGPQGDEAIQGLDGYEQLVDNFAEQAKAYWRLWGPLGEPMVRGVESLGRGTTRVYPVAATSLWSNRETTLASIH